MIKNKTFLLVFFSLFFLSEIYGQNIKDTLAASIYYKKADSLLEQKVYNKSILLFKKSSEIFKKQNFYTREADSYQKIGENFEAVLNYNNALKFYKKSFNLRKEKLQPNDPDIASSLLDLAFIKNKTSNYIESLGFFKKALKITLKNFGENHEKTGNIYNNIGLCYYNLGDLYTSLKYLQKSLDIDLETLEKTHINIGFSYINIGLIYFELKQDDKAIEYYQKSLSCFVKNEFNRGIIGVYNNTGNILKSEGKWNKALKYYQKSLAITLKHYKQDFSLLSIIYMNIGNTYRMLDEYDKALIYLNKSLKNHKSTSSKNSDDLAKIYDNIGALYTSQEENDSALKFHTKALEIHKKNGNNLEIAYSFQLSGKHKYKFKMYNEALQYHKKALKIIEKAYGAKHLLTSIFYYDVGITYYKIKDFNKALKYLNKSLISNSKKATLIYSSPLNPNDYFDHQVALKTLHNKAKTLQALYLESHDFSFLQKSIQLYYQADTLIDHIRQSFNNHEDKLVLAKQAKAIYSEAIAIHLLQFEDTGDKKAITDAWYFTEKSRSNTLKDLLNDTNSKIFANLPDTILNFEKKTISDRAYYESQIAAEQSKNNVDTTKIKHFENELFSINKKKDSLIELLKKNYPKHHKSKYVNTVFSVEDIQKKINNKTTVLEFFTTKNKTYAFIISKKNIFIKTLKTPKLDKKIEAFRKAITLENINKYKKIAYNLHQELISPLSNKLIGDELIIIPDGALWYLNFDLLLTKTSQEQNNRNLSYLLRDYAISYANSADLLFNPARNDNKKSKMLNQCLAFSYSNPVSKSVNSEYIKDDLPGTQEEIKAICKIIDGQFLYGSEATEATFKNKAKTYRILHLALHGEVDNINPQNSKLYFTQSKDSIEDNILFNHELFALSIPTDLVVLSACNTGVGKIANGEGLMSLGNAFQYAGSKSLMLSNWEVPDKTTPKLMTHFYLNLQKGLNKSKALQQAKLKYLTTAEAFYTNPFYWGSFYIVGDTNPISFETNSYDKYYWLFGILIILAFAYFSVKKIRN